MSMESRPLTIADKVKVVMELRDYLRLSPEDFRALLLHVMKGNTARDRDSREEKDQDAA